MLRFFISIIFLAFVFISCNMGSKQFEVDLPPEEKKVIDEINRQIMELENDLKFMVLKKEKANPGVKRKYIVKQKAVRRRIDKLNDKRYRLLDKYAKETADGKKIKIFSKKKRK